MPKIVLLVAEIKSGDPQEVLDRFREAVLPTQNYSIMIARATGEDVRRFDVEAAGLVEPVKGRL